MTISILSRHEMQDIIDYSYSSEADLLSGHKIISIFSDEGPLFRSRHENLLELNFDDVTPSLGRHSFRLFESGQAEQVLNFLLATQPEEKLLVHCYAGISRSGAVGTFAGILRKMDISELHRRHPRISPNPWVLSLLLQAYQQRLSQDSKQLNLSHESPARSAMQ